MIFISKYGKYELQCRPEVAEQYATGMGRVTQEALYATFTPASIEPLTQHQREEAIHRFYLTGGLPQNVDEATHVEPDYRIGRFDSRLAQIQHGWSDNERELVEQELLRHCDIYPEALFRVAEVESPAPWPAYDSFKGTPAQLAKKVSEDGYDVHEVIAYEMANQNRDAVIAALGTLAADQEEILSESDLEVVG